MDVKTTDTFTVGSKVFFSKFEDYVPHDEDTLHIIDYPLFGESIQIIRNKNKDDLLMYNFGKDKLIELTRDPLQVGKFLVPEFAKYIDLTIDDLKKLKPMLDKIDDKHSYEKLIYKYYIENNDFYLTDEQLNEVYKKYKKFR